MLHRHDERGLTVITQPAHAWISGQLAAHWGNESTGMQRAGLRLRLAAEQHDIAWLDWESRPALNPRTGLPYAFTEMPTLDHLALWSTATPRALAYGSLPAVLISMHGTYLYRRFHDFDSDTSAEADAARAFLRKEEEFQANAVRSLVDAGDISQAEIDRKRTLVSLWDAMSLALCMGFSDVRTFDDVPADDGTVALSIENSSHEPGVVSVEPWPFIPSNVFLRCEGKRLEGTFDDEEAMQTALAEADTVPLRFTLRPAALAD